MIESPRSPAVRDRDRPETWEAVWILSVRRDFELMDVDPAKEEKLNVVWAFFRMLMDRPP